MRLYFLGNCRGARFPRSHHIDRDISDDHTSRISDCSVCEGSICEISRTRYHYLDTYPSLDQYRSQSQYRPTLGCDPPIRQLWWIITICPHDRCRDTPLYLSPYGVQATESVGDTTSQKTSHVLKKFLLPSTREKEFFYTSICSTTPFLYVPSGFVSCQLIALTGQADIESSTSWFS